jgi:hypothetical protein
MSVAFEQVSQHRSGENQSEIFHSILTGNQEVLPPVILQNKVLVSLLAEPVLKFLWNA